MLRRLLCGLALAASGCLVSNPVYLGEAGTDGGGGTDEVGSASSSSRGGSETSTAAGSAEGGSATVTSGAASSTSTVGEWDADVTERCPTDDALAVCLQFDVEVPSDVVDESPYAHPVDVQAGGIVKSPWTTAFHFDPGVRLEVGCGEPCAHGAGLTYEAWVRAEAPPENRAGVAERNGLLAMFITDTMELRCLGDSGDAVGGEIALATWTHVACVVDGQTLTGYVDGELVAEGATAPLGGFGDAPLVLGNAAPSFGQPLTGDLDRVRVWNRAFTPAQVAQSATP